MGTCDRPSIAANPQPAIDITGVFMVTTSLLAINGWNTLCRTLRRQPSAESRFTPMSTRSCPIFRTAPGFNRSGIIATTEAIMASILQCRVRKHLLLATVIMAAQGR